MFNFKQVAKDIFRGSAPSVADVVKLKKHYGINKIVSLDLAAGKKIDRACKLLGIKHVMLPIDMAKKSTLINFLNHDIVKLLEDDGPTFIHCSFGKDRSGLAIALYRIKHDHWSCNKALKEAKTFGFGIGVDPSIIALYLKIIEKSCKSHDQDHNDASDIVENVRELPFGDNYILGPGQQPSWSPYADYRVKYYPYENSYNNQTEDNTSTTRVTRDLDDSDALPDKPMRMPQSGIYDYTTNSLMGASPSLVGSEYQ